MPGLLERENVLAALDAAWERAVEGRFVAVTGAAGIGKTSLLGAFRSRLHERGARVLNAIGSEFEQGFAFGVARQLLERPLRELEDAARDRVLMGPAAAARRVLDLPGGADVTPVVDPAFAAIHALHWTVGNLAEERPLALLVDDAQWADPETASWLAYSARRTGDLPVLIVVAVRDDEPATTSGPLADLLMIPHVERLALEALSEDAIGRLVAAALGATDPSLTAACAAATGGNAFLVAELLRQIAREDTPPTTEAVAQLGPPAIARAAVARMARLSPAAVDLGRWLAVVGSAATVELSALTGLDAPAVRAAVDDLAGAGILANTRPVEFRHPVVRAAIMRELAPMKRAAAHLAAARVLHDSGRDAEDVAAQLLQTEPSGESWVAAVLLRAADSATERAAPASALVLLDRALAEPPPAELIARAQRDAALAAVALARPDAVARLRLALAAASDPVDRGRLARILAATLLLGGDASGALAVLEDAVGALPCEARGLGLALELDIWRVGQFDLAARRQVEARRPAFTVTREEPAHPGFAARDAIESVLTNGTAPDAARRARSALADGALLAAEGSESPIFQMAANAQLLAGDLDGVRASYDDAIAEATERGSRRGFLLSHAFRALAHRGLGNLADAEADARVYLEHGARAGPVHRVAVAVLVATLIDAGDLTRARDALREQDPQRGAEASAGHLLQAGARLDLESGNHDEALAQLAVLEHHEAAWGIGTPAMTQWRLHAAHAHAALGRADVAQDLAAQELERARAFGVPAIIGSALAVTAAVGEPADRLTLLEEAAAVLADSPAALERARALVALGAESRRLGRRMPARPLLNAGVDLARRCGAVSLVDHGYEELAAAGSRQRRILRVGADALTPSERRVAALAAEGSSNREIAQALFLSVRTIETHLGRAYTKLDIASREELAAALLAEQGQ